VETPPVAPLGDRYANEQPVEPAPALKPDAAASAEQPAPRTPAPPAETPAAPTLEAPTRLTPNQPGRLFQAAPSAAPPASGEAWEPTAPEGGKPAATTETPAADAQPSAPAREPATGENNEKNLVPVHPPGVEPAAARLLRQALAPPKQNALAGETVYLTDLLPPSAVVNPALGELLDSYWRLSAAVADYYLSLDERDRLLQTLGPKAEEEPAFKAALATAFARVQTARLAAVEAQYDLAQRLGMPADDNLPLPGDRPLIAPYQTYYEQLFGRQSAASPARRAARRIHDTLPLRLDAINAQAAAAEASERLLAEIGAALVAGRGNAAMYLDRYEKLRAQRREFSQSVLRYNETIGRYALLVAPEGAVAASLLPMLMRDPPKLSAATTAPPLVAPPTQAAPTGPTPASSDAPSPVASTPATSAVVPATAEEPLAESPVAPGKLRSVVVPSGQ
jgi:hypothetical protein